MDKNRKIAAAQHNIERSMLNITYRQQNQQLDNRTDKSTGYFGSHKTTQVDMGWTCR